MEESPSICKAPLPLFSAFVTAKGNMVQGLKSPSTGEPWYILTDAIKTAGLTGNVTNTAKRLHPVDRKKTTIQLPTGKNQRKWVVSPFGVIHLLVTAKPPKTEKKKWIRRATFVGSIFYHRSCRVRLRPHEDPRSSCSNWPRMQNQRRRFWRKNSPISSQGKGLSNAWKFTTALQSATSLLLKKEIPWTQTMTAPLMSPKTCRPFLCNKIFFFFWFEEDTFHLMKKKKKLCWEKCIHFVHKTLC